MRVQTVNEVLKNNLKEELQDLRDDKAFLNLEITNLNGMIGLKKISRDDTNGERLKIFEKTEKLARLEEKIQELVKRIEDF